MPDKAMKLFPQKVAGCSGEIYEDIELARHGRGGMSRPCVIINMVSSVDGKTSVGGKASGIGTASDRRAMRTLRTKVDAVMIGAGTLRAERLSLGLDAGDEAPIPLAVILSGTGEIPLQSNLVRYRRQKILVLLADSAGEAAAVHLGRHADVVRVRATESGGVDLASAIELLKSEYAVDRLLVEGGPTLNHALISEDLADELFITLAPKLLGTGGAGSLAAIDGPLSEPQNLELLSTYLVGDELFLRYAIRPR